MTHGFLFYKAEGGNVISPCSLRRTLQQWLNELMWLRDYHISLSCDLARDPVNQSGCFHTVDQISHLNNASLGSYLPANLFNQV